MTSRSTVFIGGKQIGYECLKILLENNIFPEIVITNRDDTNKYLWHESLTKLSKNNNLRVVDGKFLRSKKLLEEIEKINPEIIFCIGSTRLIPDKILESSNTGTINIHPSLLPKYRGRYSTVHAIFNGESETGVTIHWMSSKLDAGPIIFQKKIKITPQDTGRTLYEKFTANGVVLFKKFLKLWLENKKVSAVPQNEKQATYFPKGLPNNGEIDWNWNGKKIYDFIRAMTFEPFPPVSFKIGNKKMIIAEEKYFQNPK